MNVDPDFMPPSLETFRSKVDPMSSLPVLLVLISRSSHCRTIFFFALISTLPSFPSMSSFLALQSKVRTRFPVLSEMTIFSSPDLSDRQIWCPDLVWIIRVVLSSV